MDVVFIVSPLVQKAGRRYFIALGRWLTDATAID
jgi:hypothetical protein